MIKTVRKLACIFCFLSFSAAIDTNEEIACSNEVKLSIFKAKDLDVQIDFLEDEKSSHLKQRVSLSSKAVLRTFTHRYFLIRFSSAQARSWAEKISSL